MRNIRDKLAPDLVHLLQLSDIVEKHDRTGHFIVSSLDWNGADFDVPLAVRLRIGHAQLASRCLTGFQRFSNQLIQRCVADSFNQRNVYGWIAQTRIVSEKSDS